MLFFKTPLERKYDLMNMLKRIMLIIFSIVLTATFCLSVYANENILNLEFNDGYNFDYFYADSATGQNQSNCPWFVNKGGSLIYDTGDYSGDAYPTKSNGRPAYPRANIRKAVTAQQNEESRALYQFDVKYTRGFLPTTYMLRYGAEGWDGAKTADVVIVEITSGGVLKFGDYEKELSLDTVYEISVLVDVRGETRERTLYIDGVIASENKTTSIGLNPDENEDAKKVFTSSIILKPYVRSNAKYYYLDGAAEFDNVKITIVDDPESFLVVSEEGEYEYNIPLSGDCVHKFVAKGLFSDGLDASWSVVPENEGVAIDNEGFLTISDIADAGEYEVVAECSGKTMSAKIALKKITIDIVGAGRVYLPQDNTYVELKYELKDSEGNLIPAKFSLNKSIAGVFMGEDGVLRILKPDISKAKDLIIVAESDATTHTMELEFVAGYYTDFSDEDWGSESFITAEDNNKYLNPNGERANSPDIMNAPGFENAVVSFKYNVALSNGNKVVFSGASNEKADSTIDSNVWWFNFYAEKSDDDALVSVNAGANVLAAEYSIPCDSDWLDVMIVLNGNSKKATMYVNGIRIFDDENLSPAYFDYKIKQIISYAAIDDVSVYSGEITDIENIDIAVKSNLNIPRPVAGEASRTELSANLIFGEKEIENVDFKWETDEQYAGVSISGNKLIVTDEAPDSFKLTAQVKCGERLTYELEARVFTPDVFMDVDVNKLKFKGNANTDILITIFKPEQTSSIASAFSGCSNAESDNYVSANITLDSRGMAEFDMSAFDAGAYKVYVKEKDSDLENYLEFNHKFDELFSDSSNLEDDAFKTVLERNTESDRASIDRAHGVYLDSERKDVICNLSRSGIENFFIACEIVSYLSDDELSIAKAEALKKNLNELNLDDEFLDLIVKNIEHKPVCDAAYSKNPTTPAMLLDALKENSILIGLSKLANVYDAKSFLGAVGNTKYNKATNAQREYICEQVGNVKYSSIDELNVAIDDVEYPKSDKNGGSHGGSSGGGGGLTTIVPVVDTPVSTPQSKQIFSDVDSRHWANDSINALAASGIVSGSDGKFRPDESVTRAEFVKMLCERFDIEGFTKVSFADVGADDWFFAYVAGAQKEGLVNGNGNEFMPHAKITRQDAAVMVYRFMTKSGFVMQDAELDFADGDYIAGYAKIPVAALKAEALVSGVGNNMFMPVNNLTRAEAAQMIYNTLERGNR